MFIVRLTTGSLCQHFLAFCSVIKSGSTWTFGLHRSTNVGSFSLIVTTAVDWTVWTTTPRKSRSVLKVLDITLIPICSTRDWAFFFFFILGRAHTVGSQWSTETYCMCPCTVDLVPTVKMHSLNHYCLYLPLFFKPESAPNVISVAVIFLLLANERLGKLWWAVVDMGRFAHAENRVFGVNPDGTFPLAESAFY